MYHYPAHPGYLGKAIAARRHNLGLTRDEIAMRSGSASSYLAYVESNPAIVSHDCLLRLAGALETSVDVLLGAEAPDSTRELAAPATRIPARLTAPSP